MITIVVPVYNVEKYLARCIDSIIAQRYTDWELVLVDDGSNDASPEICDSYAATDARIRVIHQANGGAASARNRGMEAARGRWLTFVDSDDAITDTYLLDMVEAAEKNDCDLVVSGWEKDGKKTVLTEKVLDRKDFIYFFAEDVNFGYILGKLYRLSVVRENGVTFDSGVCWAEDALFFNKVLMYSHRAAVIPGVNYVYYTIEGSSVMRLHSFEAEMNGFRSSHDVMPLLVEAFSADVVNYFSPYAYLWRAIMAMYKYGEPKNPREVLKAIKFERKYMHNRPQNFKERLITHLLIHRQWWAIDRVMRRYYKNI